MNKIIILIFIALFLSTTFLLGLSKSNISSFDHYDTFDIIPSAENLSAMDIIKHHGKIICNPTDFGYFFVVDEASGVVYEDVYEKLQKEAKHADAIFNYSALINGGETRHIVFSTDDNCAINVYRLSDRERMSNFYIPPTQKPIFVTSNLDPKFCGLARVFSDTRKIDNNAHQTGITYIYLSDLCIFGYIIAHEIAHNLGAVQKNAPHSDGSFHCNDGNDIMCQYQFNAPCVDRNFSTSLLDCNGDDYYRTGIISEENYLFHYWNSADSRFLTTTDYLHTLFPMVLGQEYE